MNRDSQCWPTALLTLAWGVLWPGGVAAPQDPQPRQPKPVQTPTELNRLVANLHQQGKTTEAVALARRALALGQQLYPKETHPQGHPDLAVSLNNLGFVLRA